VPVESDWVKAGIFGPPVMRKRVIKIESFYCVIQVTDYRLIKQHGFNRFEWVRLEIRFTNKYDPDWRKEA
jgi:hypothetical protein